jgi:glycosyltransferase involved in cell wall biosynthesis
LNSEQIQLSIVVASWNGTASLRRCLTSLEKQADKNTDEIIVVSNFSPDIAQNGSPVSFHVSPGTSTVPELRRTGIEAARGNVVALIEDHCTLDKNWSAEIKKAHASTAAVVGGSVENASVENILDWAVYFYDYGKYMLPNRAGQADSLSGMNVSYKRAALEEIREVYEDGFFETFANEELRSRGHDLLMMPSAVVYHNKSYKLRDVISHCYHLARSYAARRVAKATTGRRFVFILGSLVLPILLPARIVAAVATKRRNVVKLARAFPFLLVLLSVWSYGEFAGYIAGEGGSGQAWR